MQNNNSLVSIIIPVFNAENYISKCIQSCLNQTYANIEIIVINDGSIDGSASIVDQLSESNSKLRVYHQSNSGVVAARTNGIVNASGEWIMFVDADDYLESNAIELLCEQIDRNVDIVCSTFRLTYVDGKHGTTFAQPIGRFTAQQYTSMLLNAQVIWGPYCKLFSSKLFADGTFVVNSYFTRGEDFLMNLKLTNHLHNVVIIDNVTYNYLQHPLSAFHTIKTTIQYEQRFIKEALSSVSPATDQHDIANFAMFVCYNMAIGGVSYSRDDFFKNLITHYLKLSTISCVKKLIVRLSTNRFCAHLILVLYRFAKTLKSFR